MAVESEVLKQGWDDNTPPPSVTYNQFFPITIYYGNRRYLGKINLQLLMYGRDELVT